MKWIAEQIAELVEEPSHEDVLIETKDKKLYFLLRQCWQEFTDIRSRWPAPTADFTVMKSLLDRSTGRTVSRVPVGKFALRMAMMKATSLYECEEENNNKLNGWAEVMNGWLTLQEKGQWLMEYFEQGKIPIGNWYDEVQFDMY